MRRHGAVFFSTLLLAAWTGPSPLVAQEGRPQTMRITIQEDGRPVANADLAVVLNALKTPKGTTGAAGEANVALDDVDPGTRVDVRVRRCVDGRVELVLIPEGELGEGRTARDVCMGEDAEAGEDCTCERLGFFIVGRGDVMIDIGTGSVLQTGGERSMEEPGTGGSWSVGLGLDYHHFDSWEDVACAQPEIVSCDADSDGYGMSGFVEYRIGGRPLGFGIGVGYGTAPDVSQTFPGGRSEVETDFFRVSPYGFYAIDRDPFELRFKLSADRFINEGTLEVLVEREGERRTIERDEGNWNGSAAVELDVPVGGGWSLRGGAGYGTSFGDDDADSGIFSAGVGVALRF